EILRELTLDPTRDYQPTGRPTTTTPKRRMAGTYENVGPAIPMSCDITRSG
ncbi:hypothetical protein M2316_004144, partial [Cellulosimicrobium cellulans]|nr:hypothetical protein [Cellulosimicrobium cellulans]